MSVSNELVRVSASASGGQTVFPFTNILILSAGDLKVYQNGVLLSLGPDYSVVLNATAPSDGDVILAAGATAADIILIERDIPRLQPTVYNPGTSFPAKSHEGALDRLTLEVSDVHNRLKYTPLWARGKDANFDWQYSNMPDAVTSKIPVFDPATKIVSWSDTGSPTSSLDFSALTGTLDVSGDDARVVGFTKGYANAVSRTIREYLEDWKSVKDFGATGDGVTDDTTSIRNAIATGGKIYFPPGDYLVSGTLTVVSGSSLVGAGTTATKIFSNGDHSFFIGTDVSDIEIANMTIEGIHPGGTGSNTIFDGINFFGSTPYQSNIFIHHMHIKNMTGRGIVMVRHITDVFVHDNHVENCLIGTFLFGGNIRTTTHNNVYQSCRVAGVFVDDATVGGTPGVDAFQPFYHSVSGNIIKGAGFDPVQTGFGIAVSSTSGISITGNVIDSAGDPGVIASPGIIINSGQDDLFTMLNVTVTGNTIAFCSSYGILIEAADQFVVTGNVLRNNHNWTSPLSNAAEIRIRSHSTTATASTSGMVSGNSIRNTGATDARATVGIELLDTTLVAINLGANAIVNLTTPYRSLADAGDLIWHTISTESSIPTHDDGFKGRVLYDAPRQLLMQSNGTKWSSVAPMVWCRFDGTAADPITIDDGHNVTNVTKSGTGSYVVNFSETLPNATYAASVSQNIGTHAVGTYTTSSIAIVTRNVAGTLTDADDVSLIIFGSA